MQKPKGNTVKGIDRHNFKHGEKTRLYQCWVDMRYRASKRQDCTVCPEWKEYLDFKKWAINNGYTDELILCRNGDSGDYKPSNVRWDTPKSNLIESFAKFWIITLPSGEEVQVYNLNQFCKDNNLDSGHMCRVSKGVLKHHKGFKVREDIKNAT